MKLKEDIFISKHDYQDMIKHEHSIGSSYFDKEFGVNKDDYSLDEILLLSNNIIDDKFNYNFSDKTCAIVGNAPTVLENQYGNFIDAHDIIVRFNHSQTKGYEIQVGTKTNFRVISAKVFGYKECNQLTSFDSNFIPTLKDEHFILKSDMNLSSRYLVGGLINNINGSNKISIVQPSVQKTILENLSATEPSAGFFGIHLFLSFFKSVNIFGFDFYKNADTTQNLHYFEQVYSPGLELHNFAAEEQSIAYLESIGRIKSY